MHARLVLGAHRRDELALDAEQLLDLALGLVVGALAVVHREQPRRCGPTGSAPASPGCRTCPTPRAGCRSPPGTGSRAARPRGARWPRRAPAGSRRCGRRSRAGRRPRSARARPSGTAACAASSRGRSPRTRSAPGRPSCLSIRSDATFTHAISRGNGGAGIVSGWARTGGHGSIARLGTDPRRRHAWTCGLAWLTCTPAGTSSTIPSTSAGAAESLADELALYAGQYRHVVVALAAGRRRRPRGVDAPSWPRTPARRPRTSRCGTRSPTPPALRPSRRAGDGRVRRRWAGEGATCSATSSRCTRSSRPSRRSRA